MSLQLCVILSTYVYETSKPHELLQCMMNMEVKSLSREMSTSLWTFLKYTAGRLFFRLFDLFT